MRKPLIFENRNDGNDAINYFNLNKYENDLGNYAQVKGPKKTKQVVKKATPQTPSSTNYKGSFGSKGWQDGLELPPFDH
jgi:hypothetical protein